MDYCTIQLDTTPPNIQINSPRYTTPNAINEITITSNEPLSSYQDIYVYDKDGNKHILTFDYDGDKFVGLVSFESFGMKNVAIYAQLKDDVGNLSELKHKTIFILGDVSDYVPIMNLEIGDSIMSNLYIESVDDTISRELSLLDEETGVLLIIGDSVLEIEVKDEQI